MGKINLIQELSLRFDTTDKGWNSRAAASLGVSRSTLSRYLKLEQEGALRDVPGRVIDALRQIPLQQVGAGVTRLPGFDQLVYLYAEGLCGVQQQLDETGHVQAPYLSALQSAFDIAAALNVLSQARLPTTLAELLTVATSPIYEWCPQFTGSEPAEFVDAALMADGHVTAECLALGARADADPEAPLYERLMEVCAEVGENQAEDFYRAWRRLVIERPFVSSRAELVSFDDLFLLHSRLVGELIDKFYVPVPVAALRDSKVRLCPLTGTRLFRSAGAWCSEFRDPRAVIALRKGEERTAPVIDGMLEVRRAARTFWTLPGRHEIELAKRIQDQGWKVTLWPKLDAIDLLVESPDGSKRWAVDMKDYLSPRTLARAFEGFARFRKARRVLVIPDYLRDRTPQYRELFNRARKAYLATPVELLTSSELMKALEA